MNALNHFKDRTEAKLRYACLFLDHLKEKKDRSGDVWVAFEEAFLFHLIGSLDALLQEINVREGFGRDLKKVTLKSIGKVARHRNATVPTLDEVKVLLDNEESWLSCAKEYRDYGTHRQRIPRVHHVGGEQDGLVGLSLLGQEGPEVPEDILETFASYLVNMKALVLSARPEPVATFPQP